MENPGRRDGLTMAVHWEPRVASSSREAHEIKSYPSSGSHPLNSPVVTCDVPWAFWVMVK